MPGELCTPQPGDSSPPYLLRLVNDVVAGNGHINVVFKKDCTDMVRRIALFWNLLEEIRDFEPSGHDYEYPHDASSSIASATSWSADLVVALQAAKRILSFVSTHHSKKFSDGAAKRISFQFQCITWKLENVLGKIPYDQFQISEEVQEQVSLVRAQLRRAVERYGSLNSRKFSNALSQPLEDEGSTSNLDISEKLDSQRHGARQRTKILGRLKSSMTKIWGRRKSSLTSSEVYLSNEIDFKGQENAAIKVAEEIKKPDALTIPVDFLCPISLELMRDPVTVSTGQTYERSCILRWIDCGNLTCPKTQQKLENATLIPNHVLRNLITQWCVEYNMEQPSRLEIGRFKKKDGSFRDVSGDMAAIKALVSKLSSRSLEERRAAVAEIRSLTRRSTYKRILIADAGGILVLVNLLTTDDVSLQVHAITSIFNLSIFENNKSLIMLAGAIPSIVQVLRVGSMEAREIAAATLFNLSLVDENKIIIGATEAIPALVELLQHGSNRGKKDAADALFSLCIYQGNKGRAVRAGIITPLLNMLADSRNCMVGEAFTILSVLASNHDANAAIVKAGTIPVLVDFLITGLPCNKENAAAILLSLCRTDFENLTRISRFGAELPLTELTKSGTERAKRKATTLLEYLRNLKLLYP